MKSPSLYFQLYSVSLCSTILFSGPILRRKSNLKQGDKEKSKAVLGFKDKDKAGSREDRPGAKDRDKNGTKEKENTRYTLKPGLFTETEPIN